VMPEGLYGFDMAECGYLSKPLYDTTSCDV
jgi:hypothetical protein